MASIEKNISTYLILALHNAALVNKVLPAFLLWVTGLNTESHYHFMAAWYIV